MQRTSLRSIVAFACALSLSAGASQGCDDEPRAQDLSHEMTQRQGGLPEETTVGALPGSASVGSTGSASYEIPLELPKGVNGFQPSASLSYASGRGNGLLGPGFALGGLQSSITRCGRNWPDDEDPEPVHFTADDALCLDGGRLSLDSGEPFQVGAVYRQLREGFRRVEMIGVDAPDMTFPDAIAFKVTDRSGVQHFYGGSSESRMRRAGDDYAWFRTKSVDTFGNEIVYAYEGEEGYAAGQTQTLDKRLVEVRYAEGFSGGALVELAYEDRERDKDGYFYGAFQTTTKRLARVTTSVSGQTLREYRFSYGVSPATDRELLAEVEACGHHTDGSVLCLPPTVFQFEDDGPFDWYPAAADPNPGWDIDGSFSPSIPQQRDAGFYVIANVDRDGDQEMIYWSAEAEEWRRWSIDETAGFAVTSGETPEPHQDKVLRPSAVNFDADPEAEILVPACEDDEGGDYEGTCRAEEYAYMYNDDVPTEAQATAIPYVHKLRVLDDPTGDGKEFEPQPVLFFGDAPARIYMLPPAADLDGDGQDDLLVCGGSKYSQATWRLMLNAGIDGGDSPRFDAYDLQLSCSHYDRYEGPSDFDGDGVADLLLGANPSDPMINYGVDSGMYRRLKLPGQAIADGTLADFLDSPGYNPQTLLEDTGLPVDNIANFLAIRCNWASPYLVPPDTEGTIKHAFFSDYLASVRGQGTNRWGDFNADGNLDALRFDIATNAVSMPVADETEDLEWMGDLCDGDGDLPAVAPAPRLRVWTNRGGSFAPTTSIHTYDDATSVHDIALEVNLFRLRTFIADLNRDGSPEVQFERTGEDDECRTTTYYTYADGTKAEADDQEAPCSVVADTFEGASTVERRFRTSFQAQIRGGQTAFVSLREIPWAEPDDEGIVPTEYTAQIFTNRPTDYLEHVTDGLGEHSQFIYAVSANDEVYESFGECDAVHRCLVGGAMWLVHTLRTDAGLTDTNKHHHTTYGYSDGRFGRAGAGFLGFEEVQSVMREDDGATFVPAMSMSRSHYDLSYVEAARGFPYAGAPEQTLVDQIIAESGIDARRRVTRTAQWRAVAYPSSGDGYFVVPTYQIADDLEFPTGACGSDRPCTFPELETVIAASDSALEHRRATTETQFDAWGNPTWVQTTSGETTSTTEFSSFIYDEGEWLLGLPQLTTRTSQTQTGESVTQETLIGYDAQTRAIQYAVREPTKPEYRLQTDFGYDDFGNLTSVTATNSEGTQRSASFFFDATAGVALERVFNGLGHETTVLEQPGTGLVLAMQEPNGNVVENEYDALGRLDSSRRLESFGSATTDGGDLWVSRDWDSSVQNSVYRVNTSVATGGAVEVVLRSTGSRGSNLLARDEPGRRRWRDGAARGVDLPGHVLHRSRRGRSRVGAVPRGESARRVSVLRLRQPEPLDAGDLARGAAILRGSPLRSRGGP